MISLRALTLLAVLGLFASNEDASSAPQPATKEHTFRGRVVHVHHSKTKRHHGTITVRHHHKGTVVTKTFHVNETTNIHANSAGKAGPSKLHEGLHVAVRHRGQHAAEVAIGHKKQQPK